MDKKKIVKKALEKGLINEDNNLTDSEIYNLIFGPGFSTSDEVTSVSVRGVGRGTIEIETKESEYATIVLRLSLALAIVDGFMVGY